MTDCDCVAFDRVQVLADPQYPNNDGIHVNASRDMTIANCRIVAGDDALVVRCNCRALPAVKPCERVTVVNCQLTSHANCIRIGWLNDGVVRNCTFSNLTMTDSACGIGIDLPALEPGMVDFGCEASLYENLVFSAITMDRIYSAPVRVDLTSDPFARLDAIRGITFSDMRCRAYQYPNFRLGKGRSVSDIRFRGCSFVKCADGSFPQKWRQVGAAYWYNDCVEKYEGLPGVTYSDCTFENCGVACPPRRLRFGVVSDVHIDGGESETRKWRTALEHFREQKVEAVVVAGDLTEQGLISEMEIFAKTWYEVFPGDRLPDGAKVERVFVFGNHDSAIRKKPREMFGNDEAGLRRSVIVGNREKVWPELFHEPYAPFYAKDVKGYRFVASHWRSSAPNAHVFEAAELPDYLRTHAAELGKAKPFFFVQHLHPLGTCHGADAWWPDGGTNTTEALKGFPNAVCFSGHSHKPPTDGKAVWQVAFTSFGTGSLSYASPLGDDRDILTRARQPEGYPVDLRNRSCSTGLLVDVYDGYINVRRLEFCTRTPLGEDWVVPVPVSANPPQQAAKRPPVRLFP